MKLENDPQLVEDVRSMQRDGESPSRILRYLAARQLRDVEMMSHFREAFGLSFHDVSCIGGWFPDASGELSDADIDRMLGTAIADQAY